MTQKLSFSAINTYTQCGRKYELRYKKNLRGKYFHAALAFGSAIDSSLNELLLTKDLSKAKLVFDKQWNFQFINKKYTSLPSYTDIVYAEADFDEELLTDADKNDLHVTLLNLNVDGTYLEIYNNVLEEKKSKGWDNLTLEKRKFFNYTNWLSLRQKGYIMLESYNKKVMHQIEEVLAVQKENYLQNSDGDKVVQYLDLIVRWKDGQSILFDNKTSARDYDMDSAARSPQLISYYHGAKEEYGLNAIGFIVLKKNILKNRQKICSICINDGSGGRHKTCDATINGKRCNGKWNERIDPEASIQIVINKVTDVAENLVLETFNEANDGIKKGNFYRNLSACQNGPIICEYKNLCWKNDSSEIVDMSNEK